jgi:hypothetical protein
MKRQNKKEMENFLLNRALFLRILEDLLIEK